ncbi:MAG TPA: AAA family ATPase [Blastocatellia bacterium]|nr:AAA family ATPase [Blastocatellia bacterium]
MYQEFYGLRDIPFNLAPDPSYLFRTDSLLEVFANLQYGIENGKGLVVVTGEVGTGKTTILRSMLQSLDRSILAAYIFNPILSTGEFFDLLAGEFRLRPQASKAAMLRMLGYMLMSRHAQGLRTVLVVDEAHLLPHHLLEEIRLLSNFETNREKLLQVILCGQPELHDLFAQPELRQLKQRVSLKCAIQPLSQHETAEYIGWRLRVAGARDENMFDPAALRMIHQFSGGIPRIINNICDNALLTGFSEQTRRITRSIIEEVIGVLDLTPLEVNSPANAASSAARQDTRGREVAHAGQSGENVHYIRRDEDDDATARKFRFAINNDCVGEDIALKFFSRVRVTRNS